MRLVSRGFVLFAGLAVFVAWGCATAGSGSSSSRSGGRNLIVSEELEEGNLRNVSAYEAVEQLRPRWLRPRSAGRAAPVPPAVFLNGSSFGDLVDLRSLQSSDINEIRFLEPRDATQQYGTGFPSGIIDVVLGR